MVRQLTKFRFASQERYTAARTVAHVRHCLPLYLKSFADVQTIFVSAIKNL